MLRAGFDFSDYFQLGGKLRQVRGVNRIAVARGAGEGRNVAVGCDGLGQDAASGVEQVYGFVCAGSQVRDVVLDGEAGVFEAQNKRFCGRRCSHGEMIAEGGSGYLDGMEISLDRAGPR